MSYPLYLRLKWRVRALETSLVWNSKIMLALNLAPIVQSKSPYYNTVSGFCFITSHIIPLQLQLNSSLTLSLFQVILPVLWHAGTLHQNLSWHGECPDELHPGIIHQPDNPQLITECVTLSQCQHNPDSIQCSAPISRGSECNGWGHSAAWVLLQGFMDTTECYASLWSS